VAALAATGATRAPGLDRAYGDQGVVKIPDVYTSFEGFTAAADGDAFVFGRGWNGRREIERILRFNHAGRRDGSYGGGGAAVLPSAQEYAAFADHAARVVIGTRVDEHVLLRRLTFDGRPDRSFGKGGVESVPCGCGGAELSLSEIGDGRILIDANREVDRGSRYGVATKVWLTELLPDGRLDRRFGRAGSVAFEIAALGSIDEEHGFYLRLRADGRPDRGLAGRGVKRLPFTVVSALGGVGGAVFAVGRGHNDYRYRAFRILPSGALDPSYHRAKGRAVPLPGRGVRVFSQGSGRVLIGGKGLTYCRSGCGYHPTMTRFRE
jgi:hypothetical protein